MRIAVLIKQIPAPSQMRLHESRLVREGVDLEVNSYCRRANAKAIELAGPDGEVVVFTMGPPSADDALREMLACGSTRGVHLSDRAFAGADTLATANVLASAIRREGPFDLVLAGLNSLDADTGQVPVEVAELLGLPFAPGIRDIEVDGNTFTARLETDEGYLTVQGGFPVVLSTAERLCDPSKAKPDARECVDPGLIHVLSLADLDVRVDECGVLGSPTTVGDVRVIEATRRRKVASSVTEAVDLLVEYGAFDVHDGAVETVAEPVVLPRREIWCSFREVGIGAELLGEAASLAGSLLAKVVAVVPEAANAGLGPMGADAVMIVPDAKEPSEWAGGLAKAAAESMPWALLVEGTRVGRVVASIVAARNGWGLTGDAIGLEVIDDRLISWKPAFGGRLEAPISSSSPVQMATVRPGILSRRVPRASPDPQPTFVAHPTRATIQTVSTDVADVDVTALQRARFVVAVGQGVEPDGYAAVGELRVALANAELGSTRKVTDKGWLARTTQVGVTGHSIAPQLVVTIGASGRFNFTVGIRNATVILAIDANPDAEIFDQADVGLVGPWNEVVPALATELRNRQLP